MAKNNKTASKYNQGVEAMKYEIARELGVNMGPDATSRQNGSVGGEMTKRLVEQGSKVANRQFDAE
ncbi:MAG: alpha/beta-type small acid-soluble spore protein [Bacilli bacterium]|nr:alpha/beta-type small acid-soluble spore protein [Bacilli bacterium]